MSGTPPDSPEVEEGSPFGGAECDDSSPEPAQQVSVDHDLGNVNEFPFVNVSVELYGSHKNYSNVKAEQNYLENNDATPRSPDVENIETSPDLYLHMNDDEGPDNNNSDAYETIVVKSEPFEPDYQNPKKTSPEDLQYILPNDCEELRLPVGSQKLPLKYSFSTKKNPVKEVSQNQGRKRKRDPTTWKRNKAKVLSCCPEKCLKIFDEVELSVMLTDLNTKKTKDEQDVFLQRLMEVVPVGRKRPRMNVPEEKRKPRGFTVHYKLLKSGIHQKVCKQAFMKTFQVTKKRVQRIRELLSLGKSPVDMRGRKTPSFVIKAETLAKIHSHISSFPTKVSHSTGKEVTYLNADLNVKIMYTLFKEKYPDETFSYQFYWQYFKKNFSLRFGRPARDIKC